MIDQSRSAFVCLASLGLASTLGLAGPAPDDDFEWVIVGDTGNRLPNAQELQSEVEMPYGAVNYRYRISRKETTVSQWLEFVRAYAPHWQGAPWALELTDFWITYDSGGYEINSGAHQAPIETSFRLGVRFANWLHNGKVNEAWAFETGAYDLTQPGNPQRSANARYWIPSFDEWTKAMHYDPNRYGPGEGGYWAYPHGSDEPPIAGYPDAGGETNGGLAWGFDGEFWDVGSYPSVQSPWGLLDGSGGAREMTDSYIFGNRIIFDGSRFGEGPSHLVWDHISFYSWAAMDDRIGIRLASIVPSPSTVLAIVAYLSITGSAKRRRV